MTHLILINDPGWTSLSDRDVTEFIMRHTLEGGSIAARAYQSGRGCSNPGYMARTVAPGYKSAQPRVFQIPQVTGTQL